MEEVELFTWFNFKLPKVIVRKLGRHRFWGYFYKNKIHLDSRLEGKNLLEILLHEGGHAFLPELSEDEIRKLSRKYTELLWQQGWRKVDNKE